MKLKWIAALLCLSFGVPAYAKLYLVELRTRGQAQGSVHYRTNLELERGVSERVGEFSTRNGSTVNWEEEHLALIDIDGDLKAGLREALKKFWAVEIIGEPSEVTDIRLDFNPRNSGSFYFYVTPDKLRILPKRKNEFAPHFNVQEFKDYPSFKARAEQLKIKSQQDGKLKIRIKTTNRARFLTLRGADSFYALGLDWRKMESCEAAASSFTNVYGGTLF